MENKKRLRKNPSREICETIIKRILMTEVLQHGRNRHFKKAADFMDYFESLYPPSDALSKQVQRAVSALNMPKDDDGYLIANKTADQFVQEQEISHMLADVSATVNPMEDVQTVFLSVPVPMQPLLIQRIEQLSAFEGKYITIVPSSNGLLFYTDCKNQLLILLNSLINQG